MPGYGAVLRVVEADDSELLAIARGDSVDVYTGQKDFVHFTCTRETMIRLGAWVLWWWVFEQWFGLRVLIWYALLESLLPSTHGPKAPRKLGGRDQTGSKPPPSS